METTFAELKEMIRKWESATTEFKESLTPDVAKSLSTDMAALANSVGGRIVFGVTDDRRPVGCLLNGSDRNRVSQASKDCSPAVGFSFEDVEGDKVAFSVVRIAQSPVFHSDVYKKVPIRVGTITDYLDALGIVTLARARAVTTEGMNQQDTLARAGVRKDLSGEETALYLAGIEVPDFEVRALMLRHLENQMRERRVFGNRAIVAALPRPKSAPSHAVLLALLGLLRWVGLQGDSEELEALAAFLPDVKEAAVASRDYEVCRSALDTLLAGQSTLAVDLVEQMVREASDELYGKTDLKYVFQNNRSRVPRMAMVRLLLRMATEKTDERTTNRLRELMGTVLAS